MIYTKPDEKIRVEAGTYTLEVTAENIAVILAGERVALLRPGSAVNVLKADGEIGEDKAEGALTCSFADKRDADGSYVFTWTGKSANWEKKEYVVRAKENCFEYFVRVTGKGDVDSVKYFIGDCGDWLCGSEYDFDTGYMPIPTVNGASQCEFSAQCSYDELSYLTVPPMFCYTFDIRGMIPKLAFGLVADRGEHNAPSGEPMSMQRLLHCRVRQDCRHGLLDDAVGIAAQIHDHRSPFLYRLLIIAQISPSELRVCQAASFLL